MLKNYFYVFALALCFLLSHVSAVNAQVAPSTVDVSGFGVQPGSVVTVNVTIEDQDGTINNYTYTPTADASGAWSIPVMNADYVRDIVGRVDYTVNMTAPQLSPTANQYTVYPGGGRPSYTAYRYPTLSQNFTFDWNRITGGIRMSGRMTPEGTIRSASPGDGAYGGTYSEYDDRNIQDPSTLNSAWRGDVSVGDYTGPLWFHNNMDLGTTQFSALIQNMYDPNPNRDVGRRCCASRIGNSNPIHQTGFDIDVNTVIPPLPPSQGTNSGNPNSGGGSGAVVAAAAIAAFLASVLFGADDVNDTYAGTLLQKFAAQISTNVDKEIEIESTLADYEQVEQAKMAQQSIQTDSVDEAQVPEGVCEIVSLSEQDTVAISVHKDANHRVIRKNLSDSSLGKRGSLGAMSDGERVQFRVRKFREEYCPVTGSNGGLAEFCGASTIPDEDIAAHLDPSCVMGWKTLEGDPVNGVPNEACMMFLNYVTSAHDPLELPSKNQLADEGASEMDALIMEYYEGLKQHGSLIYDTQASMLAKTLESPNSAGLDEFRELLTELGFDPAMHIPSATSGLSEVAQLELVSKFMVGNPAFMLKLQDQEESIHRVRALLRSISLRIDDGVADMIAEKGRHMAAMNGLLLRDDREQANTALQLISKK